MDNPNSKTALHERIKTLELELSQQRGEKQLLQDKILIARGLLSYAADGVLRDCGNSYVNACTEQWLRHAASFNAYPEDGPFIGRVTDVRESFDEWLSSRPDIMSWPESPIVTETGIVEPDQVEPGCYRYCISQLSPGAQRYGPCEVCNQPCVDTHYLTEEVFYRHDDGPEGLPKEGWTTHLCNSYFGHKACLLTRLRTPRLATT